MKVVTDSVCVFVCACVCAHYRGWGQSLRQPGIEDGGHSSGRRGRGGIFSSCFGLSPKLSIRWIQFTSGGEEIIAVRSNRLNIYVHIHIYSNMNISLKI